MIDPKYIELMNKEIDGLCSDRESADLKGYLKEHPEAASYYKGLCSVARMFGEVGQLEPPAGLRNRIFSRVFGEGARTVETRPEPSFFDVLRLTFNRKFAYAFAAGLVIGICLFTALFRTAPTGVQGDLDHLYGTLATKGRFGEVLRAGPIEFELDSVSGCMNLQYTSDTIVGALKLSSKSRIRVVFEYPAELTFEGLRAVGSRDYALEVAENTAELTHVGSCDYVAVFKGSTEACPVIELKIFSGGDLLLEKAILLGRK
ncbi:MAG: hypothetical protein JSW03_04115 [Candidatus Eiseniibacteriota bacterium]|nr:MAG: hypothetical protein JSW03_04115 [Candidatus Eisenbacteria bacterium]